MISSLDEIQLQSSGFLVDLPGAVLLEDYRENLRSLIDRLTHLATGPEKASEFEDIVGSLIQLCFFRSLTNLQPQVTNLGNTQRRDWMVSNTSQDGFWEMVRQRYKALQIVWECKNYEKLEATDFNQIASRYNDRIGQFHIIAYRGDWVKHYGNHVRNIANDQKGMLLLLGEDDLKILLRQALNGKNSEPHLQSRFDDILRVIG